MAKDKMMSRDDAESFLFKVDMEGLAYAVQNYAPKKTKDKRFDELVKNLTNALMEMEAYVDELREYYEIDVA